MASDAFRELCALMLHAWEKGDDIVSAMNRARNALDAAPAPAGGTALPSQYTGPHVHVYREGFHAGYALGTAPPPAAEGEVAELVAWLRDAAEQAASADWTSDAQQLTRAADLLERQQPRPSLPPRPPVDTTPPDSPLERYGVTWDGSPDKPLLTPMPDGYWTPWHIAAQAVEQRQQPRPVSVADHPWEREGWCDANGECWIGFPRHDETTESVCDQPPMWVLEQPHPNYGVALLPATALPLPEAAR